MHFQKRIIGVKQMGRKFGDAKILYMANYTARVCFLSGPTPMKAMGASQSSERRVR